MLVHGPTLFLGDAPEAWELVDCFGCALSSVSNYPDAFRMETWDDHELQCSRQHVWGTPVTEKHTVKHFVCLSSQDPASSDSDEDMGADEPGP